MDNKYYISDDLDESALESLSGDVLMVQIRKIAHILDKKLQFSQSKTFTFSENELKRLTIRLKIAQKKFDSPKPDLQWALKIKDNFEQAIAESRKYKLPWVDKPIIKITPDEFEKLILTRRSIRCFTKEEIPDEIIKTIVKYGSWAPSTCNMQGIRFIVVKNPKMRTKIIHDRFSGDMGYCTIAVIADYRFYDDWNIDGLIHDSAAAIENMLIACNYFGIGACYISDIGVNNDKKREALNIKEYEKITALIWMGQYEKLPAVPERRDIAEIIEWI